MKAVKLSSKTVWIFLFCTLTVVLTQFFLLKGLLDFSLFSEDDWKWVFLYRSLPDTDILSKMAAIWKGIGIHGGGYAIYMGLLGELLGNNYLSYQYLTVLFKIAATLTVFPLVYVLFKNRILAFLTTIIFGVSSASTGSFYWYMKGGVFLGIALMNLFFLFYYYTLLKKTKLLLLISSVLIFLSYISSPTRIYPVFLIVFGVEVYLLVRKRSLNSLKQSIIRLTCFLLPSVIVAMQAPLSPQGNPDKMPFILLNQFLKGNLYDFLSPLSAMGYSLFTNAAWKYFGAIDYSTFSSINNYLQFLFKRPLWIFVFFLFLLSPVLSKSPKRFIVLAFGLNFILSVLMFFIVSFYLRLPGGSYVKLDPSLFNITKYPTLIAIFIIIIAFLAFMEWLKERMNLLMPVFIGPLFALIFIVPMWISIGFLLDGYSSTQYYYQIPAIGMSLFLASLLVLSYERFNGKNIFHSLVVASIIAVIVIFYQASSKEINYDFLPIYPERIKTIDQQILHNKLTKKLGNPDKEGNILVYFDLPDESSLNKYYKRSLLLDTISFPAMLNWRRHNKESGCVGNISDFAVLQSSLIFKDGRWGFLLNGKCKNELFIAFRNQEMFYEEQYVFYGVEGLNAFKIDKGEVIDIRESLLKELKYP